MQLESTMQQRRARRSESTWREIIARHAESGQAVEVFCREQVVAQRCSRAGAPGWQEPSPEGEGSSGIEASAVSQCRGIGERGEPDDRLELGGGIVLTIGMMFFRPDPRASVWSAVRYAQVLRWIVGADAA
ncbi:MAG: hypothetical protein U1F35_04265 [Steroidobacteraceae bacterium]